jgi:hypothetical protein
MMIPSIGENQNRHNISPSEKNLSKVPCAFSRNVCMTINKQLFLTFYHQVLWEIRDIAESESHAVRDALLRCRPWEELLTNKKWGRSLDMENTVFHKQRSGARTRSTA